MKNPRKELDRGMDLWAAAGLAVAMLLIAGVLFVSGCQAEEAVGQATAGDQVLQPIDLITVNGLGRVMAPPDEAVVTVTVENDAPDAQQALDENSKRMNAVMERLKAEGITEEMIETSNVTVFPNRRYDPETGNETLVGYRAQNSVRVTLRDMALVGKVFAAATEAGANNIYGPEWRLAEDSEAVTRALDRAAQNARLKAEALATAAGVSVGDILVLSEGSAVTPPVVYETRAADVSEQAVTPPPINPQDIEVTATVTATYRLER
ncbi:MAG: SIMPL domain-containing protein [Thermoleophilia bacterium]|nr:SIMPL domain-containing protein [Thermoleophilia bacterium]